MFIKINTWNEQDLKGTWHFTYKIDGVRAHWDASSNTWKSRANKPLYNLPTPKEGNIFEVYLGSFKETIKQTRSKTKNFLIPLEALYRLDPIDPRLDMYHINNPSKELIKEYLNIVNKLGYEGLVLRQKNTWLKIKPTETYDVPILSFIEGKGKHINRLGAIITPMGKVGTGFTDEERIDIWNKKEELTNTTIEASCMQLTEEGKFRHPRFIRLRPDK